MTNQTKKDVRGVPAHLSAILAALPNESRLEKLLLKSPISARTLMELAGYLLAADNRERQQSAANKKHLVSKTAREFVCKLWHKDRVRYKFNIEFSTAAASAVLKKFNFSVKPETISRDWLKGIEPSKSMRVESNAIAYVDGRYIKSKLKTTNRKV